MNMKVKDLKIIVREMVLEVLAEVLSVGAKAVVENKVAQAQPKSNNSRVADKPEVKRVVESITANKALQSVLAETITSDTYQKAVRADAEFENPPTYSDEPSMPGTESWATLAFAPPKSRRPV